MGNAMHRMETRMLLRHGLEAGESKAELARRFGVSRRTIHHWIETGQLDRDLEAGASRYAERARVAHKLDAYKGIIDERLSEYPKLSAQRLFEEVRSAGYGGGYGRVRDYVREARPRAPEEPLVRFETPAGWQGQVDFGEFKLHGSSPRVRGTLRARTRPHEDPRFIPACAGNTTPSCSITDMCAGSSPRVRGTLEYLWVSVARRRFIPACAGNTPEAYLGTSPFAVHPRVCGEHAIRPQITHAKRGSSPRVRGTRRSTFLLGMMPTVHPRVCGEHFPDARD